MDLEEKKLHDAVDKFADAMKKRLSQKYNQGFEGWEKVDFRKSFAWRMFDKSVIVLKEVEEFVIHCGCDTQCVDIANFAMMIHFHENQS